MRAREGRTISLKEDVESVVFIWLLGYQLHVIAVGEGRSDGVLDREEIQEHNRDKSEVRHAQQLNDLRDVAGLLHRDSALLVEAEVLEHSERELQQNLVAAREESAELLHDSIVVLRN